MIVRMKRSVSETRTELEGTCTISDARAAVWQSWVTLIKRSFTATHCNSLNVLELIVHITLNCKIKHKKVSNASNQHISLRLALIFILIIIRYLRCIEIAREYLFIVWRDLDYCEDKCLEILLRNNTKHPRCIADIHSPLSWKPVYKTVLGCL